MVSHHLAWLQRKNSFKILIACYLVLTLFLLLPGTRISAHAADKPSSGLTLKLDVGFNSLYRVGFWTPVHVTLDDTGKDFSGTLAINTFSGLSRFGTDTTTSPWSVTESVALKRDTQKQLTLTVPLYMGQFAPHGITARLLDENGRTVVSQQATPEYLNPGDILVGILSNHSTGFSPLSAVTLPNRYSSVYLVPLNATTLPSATAVLSSFDIIVLDDFATSTLSSPQLSTLQAWVNQGGALIEVGGAAWQHTLKPLPPELLPLDVHGSTGISSASNFLPVGTGRGQQLTSDSSQQSIEVSTASPRTTGKLSTSESETVLSSGAIPLLVQTRLGQGIICYLAFDPALAPFVSWSAIETFWKGLLFRALGDEMLIGNTRTVSSGPDQIQMRTGILKILQPLILLSPWVIGLLLLSYIAMLGPIRFLVERRLKRPVWRWRIILSSIAVFSLLSYGFAFYQRWPIDNRISLIQLNSDGSAAHITTFHSIIAPGESNFQIQLAGNNLALPIPNQLIPGDPIFTANDPNATISPTPDGEIVDIPENDTSSFHDLVSEQDHHIPGGITASLSLQNNKLVGSIRNTLNASLSDVYVLLPLSFVALKQLPAGETLQIDLPLQSAVTRSSATLADTIAVHNGLPAFYFPYGQNQQPSNELQRHLAILSALSGTGTQFTSIPCNGPCNLGSIVSKGMIILPPPGTPPTISLPNGRDPLLLNGAQATLIGWVDHSLDSNNNITVNGLTPRGFNDNLVEVALHIDVSDTLNLPSSFITGSLIDEQGSDAEDTAPDTYSLTTGNVTFELVLPITQRFKNSSLTLHEPNAIDSFQAQIGHTAKSDVIKAHLYNWQTMSWDSIVFTSWTFTTTNTAAYIGQGGRVLLQIANADQEGLLIFGKPWTG